MDQEDRSQLLFGRFRALDVYAAVASLSKDEFESSDVEALSGVKGSALSDELSRLVRLGLLARRGRRGRFTRRPSALWRFAQELVDEWGTD